MKKLILGLLVSFVLILSVGFGYFYKNPIVGNVGHGNYSLSETFEELEKASDIIAIVETKQDYRDREGKVTYFEGSDQVQSQWTVTDVTVKKLLKSTDKTVKKGSTIGVNEMFFMDGIHMYIDDEYVPLKKNEKYLVFIGIHPTNGSYYIKDINNGRFQLTGEENVHREKALDFQKQALKKFEKEINEQLKEN